MSNYTDIVTQALARAAGREFDGPATKEASASVDIYEEFKNSTGALQFAAIKLADDGSDEGRHRANVLENWFSKQAGDIPKSEAPTGQQSYPPQTGSTRITPSKSVGDRPVQEEAPTGKQVTIGQEPPATQFPDTEPANSKKASLFDILVSKTAAKGGPADTEALDDSAAPPMKNENVNRGLLGSNTAPVSATKRQAKAPTRPRLKALFDGASDVAPSQASARIVGPAAYLASGGIKEAADKKSRSLTKEELEKSRRNAMLSGGLGGGALGGAVGAGVGHDLALKKASIRSIRDEYKSLSPEDKKTVQLGAIPFGVGPAVSGSRVADGKGRGNRTALHGMGGQVVGNAGGYLGGIGAGGVGGAALGGLAGGALGGRTGAATGALGGAGLGAVGGGLAGGLGGSMLGGSYGTMVGMRKKNQHKQRGQNKKASISDFLLSE